MAGNAYSTYTGNVTMTPAGTQSLIAGPTLSGQNTGSGSAGTGAGGGSSTLLQKTQGATHTPGKGMRSKFGTWGSTP